MPQIMSDDHKAKMRNINTTLSFAAPALSDKDLNTALDFYFDLEDRLSIMGDVFLLAHQEAKRRYDLLEKMRTDRIAAQAA